jgi:hypothetical protein
VFDLFPVIEALIPDLAHDVKESETSVIIDLGVRDLELFSDFLGTQALHSITPHSFPLCSTSDTFTALKVTTLSTLNPLKRHPLFDEKRIRMEKKYALGDRGKSHAWALYSVR